MDAFMGTVAPTLGKEGIKTFYSIASAESLESRMMADNEMLVFEDNGEVIGFLELKEGRHIAMLFVSPSAQKKGVGRSLISAMLSYVKNHVITVSASLTSVPAYLHYGFECVGGASESAGLKYQPMEIDVKKLIKMKNNNRSSVRDCSLQLFSS
jgi:GNAT superfamily N-acetyltransferase